MNIYLIIILVILTGEYFLGFIVERLNIQHASPILPKEFEGYYDEARYKQAQSYLKDNTGFNLFKETIFTFIVIVFILTGGFNFVDQLARRFNQGPILTGLIFAGMLLLALQVFNLPFAAYRTFVIEEKYGFNRTTPKIFISDIFKSLFLTVLIGGTAFAAILWFFAKAGQPAWAYCWGAVVLFQLFLTFIAPVLIFPLFNKFIPLEEGELRSAIENFAGKEGFKMKGVFKMDASRRSSKSNAFFTGFGKNKRIALFDTLIKKHTTDELVSVLAHEIGHYQKKHILKGLILSAVTTGFIFFLLSFFINHPGLFSAFKMEKLSVYAGLVFFSFLYRPINFILSLFANFLSRKYEDEADKFVIATGNKPQTYITALKKLSVDNLSNLTPHPLKVFLYYSHPPVLARIEAIKRNSTF